MRTTVYVLLFLLTIQAFASITMNNTNEKQLSALLHNNWYNLLPQRVIQERAKLLTLLSPLSNSTIGAAHALSQHLHKRHGAFLRGF